MSSRPYSLLILTLLALVVTNCSHKDESPAVKARSVEPDLVCNAQLTTPVAINGEGFAPVTTKALSDKPVLVLPSVMFSRTKQLNGDVGKAEPFVLPGEPDKKNASALSWQSGRHMTASISEKLALDPGIYSVSVTNPDGEKKAILEDALAVVPPPELAQLEPASLCDAQADQTLVLRGSTFLKVGDLLPTVTIASKDGSFTQDFQVAQVTDCFEVPGRSKVTQSCKSATLVISAKALSPGDYSVVLTNPAPAACTSTQSVTLTVNPPPEVVSVAPATVCSGGSDLTIAGKHFQAGAGVELRCGSEPAVAAQTVTVQNGDNILASFGPGIDPGITCDVVVINPDRCSDEPLPHKTVTGTEGPIAFYADPPVSYTALSTRLTIYLTAVSGSFDVSLIAADGKETVLSNAALVSGSSNRIQATVPANLAAGSYDIAVRDESGCRATLNDGLILTEQLAITLASVDPPFAQAGKSTAVTISRAGGGSAFAPTPRVFLMPDVPQVGDVAIQLGSVTVVDASTLTAIIPASATAGLYDLVVVNPAGTEVGLLDKAMTVTAAAPPIVDNVVPQSFVSATGQQLEVRGRNFTNSAVALRCVTSSGVPTTAPNVVAVAPSCAAGACVQAITVDGSAVAAGGICVVRLTNSDGSYGEFSAVGVTNSSYNLSSPRAGQPLLNGRRALGAAAVMATRASRFVYAIGGDTGDGTIPRSDVEISGVDIFGTMQPWKLSVSALLAPRSLAGSATLGRYVYVVGGTSDGAAALSTGERALVLSPEEVPVLTDVDLCLAGGTSNCFGKSGLGAGVGTGTVSYRIAAVIDPADPQNLGGETLPSETVILKLPSIAGRNISVKLTFVPPVDSTGATLTGITSYRVYRTPLDGVPGRDEKLLATLSDPTSRSFIDDGSASVGTATPKPPGSTSDWQAIPALNTARAGLNAAIAPEPASTTQWQLYALLGKSTAGANGGTVHASYEHLRITVLANGRQTLGNAWTTGANASSSARWRAGAWTVDHETANLVSPGNTWIFLGGGELANGNGNGTVDAALVSSGGELNVFDASPGDFSSSRSGYGTAAAAGRLFAFGGRAPNAKSNATAAAIVAPVPSLANNAWNNEGLNMNAERYLPGVAIQSAFIFLVGGQNASNGIETSTELVVW